MQNAVKYFKFPVKCVQTDNGQEFTKTFSGNAGRKETFQHTLFQKVLMTMGIRHKQIRPYTPRHNGKVERSHRKDNEMFYAKKTFYSLEDYNKQLRRYMNEYNNFPMRPLGWKPPMSSSLLFSPMCNKCLTTLQSVFGNDFATVDVREELCYHSLTEKANSRGATNGKNQ